MISDLLLFAAYVTVSLGMYVVYLGMHRITKYLKGRARYKLVLDFLPIGLFSLLGIAFRIPVFSVLVPLLATCITHTARAGRSISFYFRVIAVTAPVAAAEMLVMYHLYALQGGNVGLSETEIFTLSLFTAMILQVWMIHTEVAWHYRKERWGKYYLIGSIQAVITVIWTHELFRYVESEAGRQGTFLVLWIKILLEFYLFYYSDQIRLYEIEKSRRIQAPYNRDEYYIAMKEEHLKIRRMYHDMQNQLMILQEAVEEKTGDISKYLKETTEMIRDVKPFYHTGNQQLNIFLFESERRAREKGIAFHVNIQEHCLDFMSGADMKAIFINAIANAIEACEKMDEGDKSIEIMAGSHLNDIIITFVNTKKPGSTRTDLSTTKTDKGIHGIGLTSIQRAVDEYDGYMMVEDEENKFRLSILFVKEEYENSH